MSIRTLGRILIVDDEIELAAALCDSLKAQGYDTVSFPSGNDALELLKSQSFDLLLTDLMMPEMDGITLFQAALEIDPHLVGIIMTGQGTVPTAVEAMKAGVIDYILKPFKLQMLLPVLTRALAFRRLSMENIQLRETMAIYEMCQTIAHTLEFDTVANKAADAALQQLEADEVSLMLPTQDGNDLYIAVVRGERREGILGNRVPFSQGIAGWVARNQSTVMLEGQVDDQRFTPLCPRPEICSAVSMPLLAGGRLIGVLNVNSTKGRKFTLGQIKGLHILTSTISAALESAGLYNEVQRAEERYRSIFENAVYGIYQTSPEGRFLTSNPALARILGYNSPEDLVSSVTDIRKQVYADPEERARFLREMDEWGFVTGFETQFLKNDGSRIWVSINARCVSNATGKLIYFEGSIADINDRKIAEESLRRVERRNEMILNCAGEGIYGMDLEGRFSFVNPAAARMLGYGIEEQIGKSCHALIHHTRLDGSPNPEGKSMILGLLSDGISLQETDDVFWRKDGSSFPIEYTGTPIMEEGKIRGAVVTFKDISERKKAEDALKQSEERMRLIIESSPIGMRIVQHGRHVYANPAMIRMFGYADNDEIEGLPIETFYTPEDRERVRQAIADTQAGKATSPVYEATGLTRDGKHFDVTVRMTPVDYRGQPAILAFITDVSSEKALRAQLFRAQKMEAIGTLAGGIAHDFNNILGIIMGNAEMALFDTPEEAPAHGCMERITKAAFRARDLVQQILTFSRQSEHEQMPLNIAPIIKETVKLLRSSLPSTIEIVQEINVPFSGDAVLVDPTQIHQVLLNLCTNSAHAMRETGGVLEIKYSLIEFSSGNLAMPSDLSPGCYVELTVSDTGHGMSKDVMERIFEPYFTTKIQEEGTGLGLSVVHGIVKKHAGGITVTSVPGKGSIFHVFLPKWQGSPVEPEQKIHAPLQRGTESILLIDDEQELLEAVCQMLERLGYTVAPESSGVEALEAFRVRPDAFDLVITDQTMPKMTGIELSKQLMAIRPDLPVILCTGFSDGLTPEKCKASGIHALVMKPVVMNRIAGTIREVLDGKEQN
ncbi:MAG: PAS domain S-box protein [Deltaproteobacteria bacterium]|nr:PAS domain S-box protein [Deltaproteobacteria bacterium]